ncbi:Tudor domain-containing protein 5 [Nymphon striatum]|nr:Tudor domain-containing protein 5 [Nymphon striatum]
MSNEPDLSDVKKLLRSLLISSKTGLSIDQLCRDFRVQEGYPLPYAKFGYPNPSTFLRECQDIAESSFRRGVHFLRGVADDNTRHIQKLVDAQKKTKAKPTRNNCASNTNTNSRYSSNHNIAPRFAKRRSPSNSNFQSDNQFDDTSSYSYKFNAESPYPGPSKNHSSEHIDLPNNIKDRLINFLNSYTTGIRIDNFSTAYRNRYGQYLDHRQYGFDSLEQLCKTLPNAEFLSGGRTAVIRSIGKDGIIAESDYSSGNGSFFEEDNSKQLTPFKAKSECDTNFITDAGDPNLNPKVRNNFIQILNRHPNGIHVSNFCEEYELLTKTPLDLNGHGYVSVMEMASANQDIFDFYRSGSDDWILMKKGNKDLASTNEDRLKKIAKNIHTILSDFKDGYPLNDFTVLYEKKLNESLTSCMENYDSVEKFLSEKFSHLVKLIEVESRTNVILKSNIHTSFSSPVREIKAIYPPSDVVDRDGRIERATLPKMEDINDGYLEINIAEVVSPSKFWFFCNDKDGSCRLDTLMNELQDVYNSDKSRTYLLPDSAVEIGHICVAPYPQDNDWYRCKITAIRDSMQVEVFYFDFGTVGLVERSTLHYLRKCFLELPAQGILGKLGYIMPINQQKIWEDKANHFFYQLATHKPVLAKVLDFNTSIVPLLMYDTNTSVDIFINDELVNNGLARYSQDPHGTTPRNLMQNSLLPSVLSNNMMSVNNMNSMAFPDPLTTAALTLQLLNQPVLQNLSQTYELMKQSTENSLAKSQDLHSEFSHHFEKVPSTMHVISPSRNPNSGLEADPQDDVKI